MWFYPSIGESQEMRPRCVSCQYFHTFRCFVRGYRAQHKHQTPWPNQLQFLQRASEKHEIPPGIVCHVHVVLVVLSASGIHQHGRYTRLVSILLILHFFWVSKIRIPLWNDVRLKDLRVSGGQKGKESLLFACFSPFSNISTIIPVTDDPGVGRMANVVGYILDPCIYIFLHPGIRETAWYIATCNPTLLHDPRYASLSTTLLLR